MPVVLAARLAAEVVVALVVRVLATFLAWTIARTLVGLLVQGALVVLLVMYGANVLAAADGGSFGQLGPWQEALAMTVRDVAAVLAALRQAAERLIGDYWP